MFDLFRTSQSNERRAFEENANALIRERLMRLLAQSQPDALFPPTDFHAAVGQGHFDRPKLDALLNMLMRESPGGGGSEMGAGGSLAMR